MTTIPIAWYLVLAAVLFCIGTFGALTRRSGIAIFLSIELMLNAANLTLVAYARGITNPQLRAAGVAYLVLGSPEYQLA